MQFDSFSAFLDMGGYGFYVWLAFFVTLVSLVALVIENKWRARKIREQVLKEHRRIQRVTQAKEKKARETKVRE
ncbi:heme exporter protein CcmD [Paraneptunicella aestuarii]|uniref:heme exporter protein CcmD n=1 Tax=Paraneptunicella aestuarii TaxID=2831148 RepID=UPI001E5E6B9F|nr:heme exporter protein CcmD [Paraneptunicella aestuarii]UAA38134.1 heme exporter protein CcmD [Paraneptunicella aestuarii]